MPARRHLLLVPLVLALAGCTDYAARYQPPPLAYDDRAPIRLAVDVIEVERTAPPISGSSFAAARMAEPLAEGLRALLRQRLRAAGGPGRLRAVITELAVEEELRPTPGGLAGLFRREPESRYALSAGVRLARLDERGLEQGHAVVLGSRARTIPAGATPAERDRIAFELVRDLIDDLDGALVQSLRESLSTVVLP
jgi:hypothetical protein